MGTVTGLEPGTVTGANTISGLAGLFQTGIDIYKSPNSLQSYVAFVQGLTSIAALKPCSALLVAPAAAVISSVAAVQDIKNGSPTQALWDGLSAFGDFLAVGR